MPIISDLCSRLIKLYYISHKHLYNEKTINHIINMPYDDFLCPKGKSLL